MPMTPVSQLREDVLACASAAAADGVDPERPVSPDNSQRRRAASYLLLVAPPGAGTLVGAEPHAIADPSVLRGGVRPGRCQPHTTLLSNSRQYRRGTVFRGDEIALPSRQTSRFITVLSQP